MISGYIRFGRASCLDDHLEVLVKLPKQFFDRFGLNTRAHLDGRYTEESIDLSNMIHSQYEQILELACPLSIFRITRELATDSEALDSPGDMVFKTLYDAITLFLEIETKLNRMHLEAVEVLKWLREHSTEEDADIAVRYGGYVSRVRGWHTELSELEQKLQRPLEWDLEDFLTYSTSDSSHSGDGEQ